jgi:ribose-phosphate pyrophosphokinase
MGHNNLMFTADIKTDPWIRSKNCEKLKKPDNVLLLSGNANRPLAEDIARHLGTNLGDSTVTKFSDSETNVQIKDNIRGKNVYIVQPTCPPLNDNLIELLLMISATRKAAAKRVIAVIPYYGFAKQDRKDGPSVQVSAADIATLLETVGVDRMIALDLHSGQVQGFFNPRVPVDNINLNMLLMDYILKNKELFDDLNNIVVVSPKANAVTRAKKFQHALLAKGYERAGLAMVIKQRNKSSQILRMDLVGTVEGRDCIIIDDIIEAAVILSLHY